MSNKYYEKVLIGQQRTSRDLRQLIDGGPFGGLQGKAVDVLWRVYAGEEVTNISPQTLQLVQAGLEEERARSVALEAAAVASAEARMSAKLLSLEEQRDTDRSIVPEVRVGVGAQQQQQQPPAATAALVLSHSHTHATQHPALLLF